MSYSDPFRGRMSCRARVARGVAEGGGGERRYPVETTGLEAILRGRPRGPGEPVADCRGAEPVRVQHVEQAERGKSFGTHELLLPRVNAWHHERGPSQPQRLADGVVAAHRDHARGPSKERHQVGDETAQVDVTARGSGSFESRPRRTMELAAGDDDSTPSGRQRRGEECLA